jgi:hypothetical protein
MIVLRIEAVIRVSSCRMRRRRACASGGRACRVVRWMCDVSNIPQHPEEDMKDRR